MNIMHEYVENKTKFVLWNKNENVSYVILNKIVGN